MRARAALAALLLSAIPAVLPAVAGNDLVPGELKVDESTLHAIGYRWLATGDDNRNASATVEYRRQGETTWRRGPAPLRLNGDPAGRDGYVVGNLLAGSVLWLEPDVAYEVRVTLADPDGVTGTAATTFTARTRAVPPRIAGSRTLHLYTTCTGTDKLQPCYTRLQDAARDAQPGEVVLLHAGTYAWTTTIDLSVLATKAATETAPVVFRGEDRDRVVIDMGRAPGRDATKLFSVVGAKYAHFESFTVRNAGTVFYGRDAVGLTIRDLRLLGVYAGIGGADSPAGKDRLWYVADNTIEGFNTQWYPYSSQSTSISHTGIRIYGRGHVVEHNRVGKFWDCIAHSDTGGGQVTNTSVDWRNPPSLSIDVDRNDMYECFDDALSADYGFHNLRFIGNRMTNAHTALSVQPLYGGPAYFIRNEAFNMASNSFKFHNQPVGIEAYHNSIATHDFAWECDAGWRVARIRNNLLLGNPSTSSYALVTGSPPDARNAIDYNGYTGTTGSNLLKWNRALYAATPDERRYPNLPGFATGEGHEAHGRIVPYTVFADAWYPAGEGTTYPAGDADLSLRSASAAIDAGLFIPGINDGFAGAAPDLGAQEYGSSPPAFGPRDAVNLPPGTVRNLRIVSEAAGATSYQLSWEAPDDGGAAESYRLYATTLQGSFKPSCEADLGSGTSIRLDALTAGRGFVAVARNAAGEGSYGTGSAGAERPHATTTCP